MGGYLEVVFQHHVGGGEALGYAAPLQRHYLPEGQVAAGVYGDGVGGQRRFRGHVVGQHGVFDPDELQRRPRGVRIVSGYRHHLVAHEAHSCVKDAHIRREAPVGGVEGRGHGADAGQAQGLGSVDAQNVGVRVRAAQDGPVEHSRQLEVGGIAGLAGELHFQVAADHTGSGYVKGHSNSPMLRTQKISCALFDLGCEGA